MGCFSEITERKVLWARGVRARRLTGACSRALDRDEPERSYSASMKHEVTAIIEPDGDWHIAYCPEVPGANGQGKTKEEAPASLIAAIELIQAPQLLPAQLGKPQEAGVHRRGPSPY